MEAIPVLMQSGASVESVKHPPYIGASSWLINCLDCSFRKLLVISSWQTDSFISKWLFCVSTCCLPINEFYLKCFLDYLPILKSIIRKYIVLWQRSGWKVWVNANHLPDEQADKKVRQQTIKEYLRMLKQTPILCFQFYGFEQKEEEDSPQRFLPSVLLLKSLWHLTHVFIHFFCFSHWGLSSVSLELGRRNCVTQSATSTRLLNLM